MGERVAVLAPVRAPQAFAAAHAAFLIDMVLGQFADEARGDRAVPLAVDPPVGGVEDRAFLAGAGDRDIGEAAFFLEAGYAALVKAALRGKHAFFPAGAKDIFIFEAFCAVHGQYRDLGLVVACVITRLTCSRKSPSVSYSSIARASSVRFSRRPAASVERSAWSIVV